MSKVLAQKPKRFDWESVSQEGFDSTQFWNEYKNWTPEMLDKYSLPADLRDSTETRNSKKKLLQWRRTIEWPKKAGRKNMSMGHLLVYATGAGGKAGQGMSGGDSEAMKKQLKACREYIIKSNKEEAEPLGTDQYLVKSFRKTEQYKSTCLWIKEKGILDVLDSEENWKLDEFICLAIATIKSGLRNDITNALELEAPKPLMVKPEDLGPLLNFFAEIGSVTPDGKLPTFANDTDKDSVEDYSVKLKTQLDLNNFAQPKIDEFLLSNLIVISTTPIGIAALQDSVLERMRFAISGTIQTIKNKVPEKENAGFILYYLLLALFKSLTLIKYKNSGEEGVEKERELNEEFCKLNKEFCTAATEIFNIFGNAYGKRKAGKSGEVGTGKRVKIAVVEKEVPVKEDNEKGDAAAADSGV